MHSRFVTFETQRHADGGSSWKKPEAFFEIRELSPIVTLDRIVGVIDEELAGVINAAYDDLLSRRDRPHTFHDWSGVVGYSPTARKSLTGAVDSWRGRMRSVHILVSSRVLAMGISVANAVLGSYIQAYADPQRFRDAMEQALRGE
jgi:hypothetical protein